MIAREFYWTAQFLTMDSTDEWESNTSCEMVCGIRGVSNG